MNPDRGAVVRWNVDLILRWIINGITPDEYVRSELHELLPNLPPVFVLVHKPGQRATSVAVGAQRLHG